MKWHMGTMKTRITERNRKIWRDIGNAVAVQ